MNTTKFLKRHYILILCVLAQVYGCINLNPLSLFVMGWCLALLFSAICNEVL